MMVTLTGYIEPMTKPIENRLELANEAFVLIFTYHLYQFTNFMTDADNRTMVGKSLVILTTINVLLNIVVVSSQVAQIIFTKAKLLYLKRK